MKRSYPWVLLALALTLVAPSPAQATITFKQLDDGLFIVSHRVKIIGSRGQAMDMAYTKAASLCVAAGYTHFEILEEKSEAGQSDDSANASLRVRFSSAAGGERIDCQRNADPKYIEQARTKLAKQGYQKPATETGEAASVTGASGDATSSHTCTLEQIAAMARAGLSDEQIRGACGVDDG